MATLDQGSAISVIAPKLIVQFLVAGVQLVGQLYEIHSLQNGEHPVEGWDTCSLHSQSTMLSDSIANGCLREIGPLPQQDQALDDLRTTCHLTLLIILSRLRLIQELGPHAPLRVGELQQLWPREDVEALEERLMSLKTGLEEATLSAQRYVPKLISYREIGLQVTYCIVRTAQSSIVRLFSPWTLLEAERRPEIFTHRTKYRKQTKIPPNLVLRQLSATLMLVCKAQ